MLWAKSRTQRWVPRAGDLDRAETAITWDLALALPQVLGTSGALRSLYGLERLAVVQAGEWYYPQLDAIGSVRQWTDAVGAVVGLQGYAPFGEALVPLGPSVAPWGFTGEWEDPAGLVYLRARWYHVALGRFTQVDPWPGLVGLPTSRHPYSYVSGNPLRHSDPSGEVDPFDVVFITMDVVILGKDIYEGARYGWTDQRKANLFVDTGALGIDLLLLAVPGIGGGGRGAAEALRPVLVGAGRVSAQAAIRAVPRTISQGVRTAQAGFKLYQGVRDPLLRAVSGGPEDQTGEPTGSQDRWKGLLSSLPEEMHHFLSDKSARWSERFRGVVGKYGLGLDDCWNKSKMPHRGRHAEEYHQWVWTELRYIDREAGGDVQEFLRLFYERIVKPVLEHPETPRKGYWQ